MDEIVTFGHPSLKTRSCEITEFNEDLKILSERMIKIMYEAPGVGLAAPQIGINKNIFVFDAGNGAQVAVNPKKIEVEGSSIFLEGCLSLPGYYWEIERPEFAKIFCQNLKGEDITYEGDELTGRVLQHEFDHLKGKLLLSSLTRKERKEAIKKIAVNGFPGNDI
jgi:peptide deformylase